MSDIFHFYKSIISKEFASNFKLPEQAINESSFVVESPKNEDNGDLSTNICMVLSKELSEPPIQIAEILKTSLERYSEFEQLEIAKPGFLNFPWELNMTKYLQKSLAFLFPPSFPGG